MYYTFKFKRKRWFWWFWSRERKAIGHGLEKETDMMTVWLFGGGFRTIRHWDGKSHEMHLGRDYGTWQAMRADKDAGQTVQIKDETGIKR